ncbi:MAG: GntR family transcriptional regulator [Acholeplasmataceae bacterium]|nr:GntR family transcriptional regulator [Acholeplasmataceae bacterium]
MKDIKFAIDKRSTVSVVDQIKDYIYIGIMKLKIQNGDILPNIEDLAIDLNVPKVAIKNAYQKLIDIALIMRINGHYEVTYNSNPNVFHNQLILVNETLKSLGETPEITILNKVVVKVSSDIAKKTGYPVDQELVNFTRLYKSNNQPLFVIKMYFPLDIFPNLDQIDMTNKFFYSFFRNEYKIIMSKTIRSLRIVSSNEEISALLTISKDMPIHYETTRAYDQFGRQIEYSELWCAPRHRIPSILEKDDIKKYFR